MLLEDPRVGINESREFKCGVNKMGYIGDSSDMDCASCVESMADRNATVARNETGSNNDKCTSHIERCFVWEWEKEKSLKCSEILVQEVVVQCEMVGKGCGCDVAVEAGW